MSLHHTLTAAAVAGLFAMPAAALDLTKMSAEERSIFRQEVRSYLMDNPEVIMEAVNVLEERQQQAQVQADLSMVTDNADEIFNDGFSYVGGNPDGDITLVEFLDYRCGYCKRAHGEVSKLLETDGNIRLIVKEFPILGEQSVLASRFAVATKQVAGGESYKALNDALMTVNGDVSLPMLRRLGTTLGLDTAAIEARMDSADVTEEITRTRALAQKLRITGTPTFVVHDEMLRGYLPYDQMMEMIKEKRG
ncbi:Disulfide bond formation protein D [Ascidiaceihabitans donghaensis]|uniref:Disulfide bond formation protein D n=1 Tax=Ascidiaceihabitans donghaensis TaxID=1510460 RepID=A0A2R8BEM7_9RHOB|nr:DsbA family protein [Ascidiaceihabitans donghaensis]SPH21539.1 Disulfide bond formation protein D [Ascidiaceihabitans donghaensis]